MKGRKNTVSRNLVVLTLWPGYFKNGTELTVVEWPACVDVANAEDVVLRDNSVAGSEGMAFHVHGKLWKYL